MPTFHDLFVSLVASLAFLSRFAVFQSVLRRLVPSPVTVGGRKAGAV